MKKITVIMPCLNVVQYFKECIDSVVAQTMFGDLEVLVIDAGSTDGTYEIAAHYAEKFENIRLFCSERKSYGYQVNLGIREANSKYIAILETDDYVHHEMYEILYKAAEKNQVDYVKADFRMFYACHNGKKVFWDIKISNEPSIYNKVLDVTDNAYLYVRDFSVWKGIYRRDFLIDNEILFNESKGAAYQDIGFGQKLHSCAKRALYIPDLLYCYRVGREQASVNSGRGIVYSCEEFKKLLKTWDKQKLCLKGTYEAMLSSFLGEFGLISSYEISNDKQILESIAWFGQIIENGIREGIVTEEDISSDLGEDHLEHFRRIQRNPQNEIEFSVQKKYERMKEFSGLRYEKNPVYIFGAGLYGKNALRMIDSLSVKIEAFFDNAAKEGQELAGFKVIKPDEAAIKNGAIVIIANKNHKDEIRNQLIEMGANKENLWEYKEL